MVENPAGQVEKALFDPTQTAKLNKIRPMAKRHGPTTVVDG